MSNLVKTMDAVIETGEYTDQQGNQKKRYMNIGTLFVYDNGMSLKLDAVPVGNGNISFYDKKPKQTQGQQQGYNQNQAPQQNNNYQPTQQAPQQGYNQGQPVYDENGQVVPV